MLSLGGRGVGEGFKERWGRVSTVSADADLETRAGPVQIGRFYSEASTALSRGLLSDLATNSRGSAAPVSDLARIPRRSAAVRVGVIWTCGGDDKGVEGGKSGDRFRECRTRVWRRAWSQVNRVQHSARRWRRGEGMGHRPAEPSDPSDSQLRASCHSHEHL